MVKNQNPIKLICILGGLALSTSVCAATHSSTAAAPNADAAVVSSDESPAPASSASQGGEATFSPKQVQNIQEIVHNYLVQHPDVLVEASQALQKQNEAKQQNFALNAIKENAKTLFDDTNSPMAGNPDAKVTLVQFYDYQCGHCKEMGAVIKKVLQSNKDLKVIYKELPIFGANSQYAAKAALASVRQGKFNSFHDALLATSNPLTNEKVLSVAKEVGLNVAQLKKDMQSPSIGQELIATNKLAQSLRIAGTPSFVIGNQAQTQFGFIPGATSQDDLQKEIEQVGA